VPREDIRRSFVQGRFSPRPASLAAVRKLGLEASYDAYENGRGQLETREIETSFRVDFENSDELRIGYTHSYEFIDEAFDLTDDATIPVGTYQWHGVEARYELGRQRRLSGELEAGYGGFYGGSRAQAGFSGRLEVSRRLSVEPRIGVNWIELPQASFTTTLLGLRVNAAFSPRIFLGALVQYNSEAGTLGSNLRFRWEYRPGSEIFLVYADGWDTSLPGRALLRNRSLVLKVTRLLRF
jgi:hypothetical protein